MKAKAVRLPEDLLQGIEWVGTREKLSRSGEALRRLVRLGLERDLARRYQRGEITLRELAHVLRISVREALDVLMDLGISGNVSADIAGQTLDAAARMAARRPGRKS
jgi:hypothetical protein